MRRHLSGLWVSTAPGAPAIQRLQRLCWAPGRLARQAFLFLLALIGSWVPGWSRGACSAWGGIGSGGGGGGWGRC